MRILFVCNEYPPLPHGGFGTFVKTFSEYLVSEGHEIAVIGWHKSVEQQTIENNNGVRVHLFPEVFARNAFIKLKKYAELIAQVESEIKADVVEFGDTGGAFLFYRHKNIIVRLHNGERYFKQRSKLLIFIEMIAFSLRKVKIIGVSKFILNRFKQYFKFIHPGSTFSVVYNGFTLPQEVLFRDKGGSKEIVYAGTLKRIKGIEELIQGFVLSRLHSDGYSLMIYGNDSNYNGQSYWSQLQKFGSEDQGVYYKGVLPRDQLLSRFSSSFTNIFPSHLESFGLVVIESMAVGGLTIFTDQGAAREIIKDGVDGFLLSSPTPECIAGKLIEVSKLDEEYILSIRRKARLKASLFSMSKTMEDSMKVYKA